MTHNDMVFAYYNNYKIDFIEKMNRLEMIYLLLFPECISGFDYKYSKIILKMFFMKKGHALADSLSEGNKIIRLK